MTNPKTKGTSPASKPRKPTTKSKLSDWREETLTRVRALILDADPEMLEERKWKKPSNAMVGIPVWSRNGIICTGETYTKVVKLTFARGAGLPDPSGLFNSGLQGNTRRAIDIREGERLDAKSFKALVKAAAAENSPERTTTRAKKSKPGASESKRIKVRKVEKPPVVLLSGGNPQIAKADGDAPVRAYIAALPGWKRDIGKRLDALIVRTVPNVRKAVKWNSPFYGINSDGGVEVGWFLGFHTFTRYVKVSFFRGTSLRPVPAGGTGKDARWINIHEDDFDEAKMKIWVKQAAALPGWAP